MKAGMAAQHEILAISEAEIGKGLGDGVGEGKAHKIPSQPIKSWAQWRVPVIPAM
jgi:hypothetical protein